MYSVTVLTPKGRRQQVKVTPNTTLLQILEEVCTKHGFNAKEYDLRHHNQILDISSMFRFTSLPNNAQLEMIEASKHRQESPVTLGLQLESGERLTGVFIPSDSVWNVIVTLKPEEEKKTNLVVIYMRQEIYGKENLRNMTLRSLGLTGGRAMLRLLHKSPEELHTQANVTTNLTRGLTGPGEKSKKPSSKSSPDPKKKETHKEKPEEASDKSKLPSPASAKKETQQKPSKYSKLENYNFKGNVFEKLLREEKSKRMMMAMEEEKEKEELGSKKPDHRVEASLRRKSIPETEKNDQGSKERSTAGEYVDERESEKNFDQSKIVVLGDRNAVAYNLNSLKPVSFEDEPDDFYDLTISDAKVLLKQAKQLCQDLEDAPLMTAAQRELEKDKKVLSLLHQYKKTVLRVKFPDRTVLQGTFSPVETVSEVKRFVADYLENPRMNFYLYTTPPKVILKPEDRLIECGCVPSSVLYFGMPAEALVPSQFLRPDVLERLSTPSGAALTALESRKTDRKLPEDRWEEGEKRKWKQSQSNPQPGPSGGIKQWERATAKDGQSNSPQMKLPKWFKPNK